MNKKPESEEKRSFKMAEVILEAEGLGDVNKKARQQIKILRMVQVMLEAEGWVM